MAVRSRRWICCICCIVAVPVAVAVYCEYLIYFVALWQCSWPQLQPANDTLNVMFLADTHLLGPVKGHWFDKLRREWQMYRAFQTAQSLFRPEVVFILGDIFDEGHWSNQKSYEAYLQRFKQLFYVDEPTKLYVVAGNHDIGFHYAMMPGHIHFFRKAFDSDAVRLLELKGSVFVLLNSMAMEGDGCRFCASAEHQLALLNRSLACAREADSGGELASDCARVRRLAAPYSRPLLLQHFPLFRRSDAACTDAAAAEDGAPTPMRDAPMQPRWDCLSREATARLSDWLQPRAAFGGHSHFGCTRWHAGGGGFGEWSVASFSWRNTDRPAFLLAAVTPRRLAVAKCLLPRESTVFALYGATLALPLCCLVYLRCRSRRRRQKRA